MIFKTIELNESKFSEIKSIGNFNAMELNNDLNVDVDVNDLCNYLKSLNGIDKITALSINPTSHLKNVEIIKAFPNLKVLYVYGNKIKSLDGIEWFYKGDYIDINICENPERDILKISDSKLKKICLYYQNKEDFDAIANCHFLTEIYITHCISPDFYKWRNVPLEYIKFSQCDFKELGNMSYVKTLKSVTVAGCNKFERFIGNNSSVNCITIVGCKNLDLNSLNTFKKIRSIA